MAIRSRHTELRAEMLRRGYDGKTMAAKLAIAPATFSHKLSGQRPWDSWEIYTILDILGLPYEQMHIFFPKNGISDPTCYRALPTDLPMNRIQAV